MPELSDDAAFTSPAFPGEVDMILSAMEAARSGGADRRSTTRNSYRTVADLRLFSSDPFAESMKLFTRDVHDRGVGFITRQRLPLGYGGMIKLTLPNGTVATIHCTIFRCRECISGWYEGALNFSRSQNCWH